MLYWVALLATDNWHQEIPSPYVSGTRNLWVPHDLANSVTWQVPGPTDAQSVAITKSISILPLLSYKSIQTAPHYNSDCLLSLRCVLGAQVSAACMVSCVTCIRASEVPKGLHFTHEEPEVWSQCNLSTICSECLSWVLIPEVLVPRPSCQPEGCYPHGLQEAKIQCPLCLLSLKFSACLCATQGSSVCGNLNLAFQCVNICLKAKLL